MRARDVLLAAATGLRRLGPRGLVHVSGGERGAALLAVLAMITSVLLVGAALFSLGVAESDLVEFSVDGTQAFYLAEGGLERACALLKELARRDPPVYPSEVTLEDQPLRGGLYSIYITNTGAADPWMTKYDVISRGEADGVVRQIRATIKTEPFGKYQYFVDKRTPFNWFSSAWNLDGPVHLNSFVMIIGTPYFGGKVTSSKDKMFIGPWAEPTFAAGYELGVDEIAYPSVSALTQALKNVAASGGLYRGKPKGGKAKYEVKLGRGGIPGYLSYRSYEKSGKHYYWSDWVDVNIDALNGVAWFDAPVWLEGTLDGRLTIGAGGNIYIADDVRYADSTPGSGPDPGCDDLLGLISAGDILVASTMPNLSDCEIHAAMMALSSCFAAEDYGFGPRKGDLTVYGSILQSRAGRVGFYGYWGTCFLGYDMVYHHDRRLASDSPPSFPQTGNYFVSSWKEEEPPSS